MSILSARIVSQTPFLRNDFFSLQVTSGKIKTAIRMRLFTGTVNTSELKHTCKLLKKELPSIFSSTCYNEENLPFAQEVLRTEIGHLFEHILLEYLCQEKLEKGHVNVSFEGVTNWNWLKDPYGTFRISISLGLNEEEILFPAMTKSASLLLKILNKTQTIQ